MYESFYLRAVSPEQPLGVWIRHTVHKRPGQEPRGSVWCTVFDAPLGRAVHDKLTSERRSCPTGGWIEVGDPGGRISAPREGAGACGPAQWALGFDALEPELRHLPREWLYRAPLPRTKLDEPGAERDVSRGGWSRVESRGRARGWRGMVGHNWGAEHAERWIWLHGVGFEGGPTPGSTWRSAASRSPAG